MKTRVNIAASILMFTVLAFSAKAQVGIGVSTPDPASILDLSAGGNKGVRMPNSTVAPSTLTSAPERLFIYYQNGFYLKESGGFNNMNGWKYKYGNSTDEDITFNPSSLVGVGIGINTGDVLGYLHVSASGKDVTSTSTLGSIFIGDSTNATHMLIDADEIMVKNTATVGGLLKLQEEDGSVQIGSNRIENIDKFTIYLNTEIGVDTITKNLTVHGNVDAHNGRIKEQGYDLLPRGSIIMWSGSNIPKGWALCDGLMYNMNPTTGLPDTVTTGGLTTPNLSGRMIIGKGSNGMHTYALNTTGGADSLALTEANLPNHNHQGNTKTDGAHNHTGHVTARADNDDNDTPHNFLTYDNVNYYYSTIDIKSNGSAHFHTLDDTTTTCSDCKGKKIDVRSAYYVLAYIIKL